MTTLQAIPVCTQRNIPDSQPKPDISYALDVAYRLLLGHKFYVDHSYREEGENHTIFDVLSYVLSTDRIYIMVKNDAWSLSYNPPLKEDGYISAWKAIFPVRYLCDTLEFFRIKETLDFDMINILYELGKTLSSSFVVVTETPKYNVKLDSTRLYLVDLICYPDTGEVTKLR